MTYKFEQFNVEIQNPQITVMSYNCVIASKTCIINVRLSLGAPTANAVKFEVPLSGYTYIDNPIESDIETWVTNELIQYEV